MSAELYAHEVSGPRVDVVNRCNAAGAVTRSGVVCWQQAGKKAA